MCQFLPVLLFALIGFAVSTIRLSRRGYRIFAAVTISMHAAVAGGCIGAILSGVMFLLGIKLQ